jgi:Tfp pilus assembly protein PilF
MAKFYADHDRNLVEALRLAEQRKLTRNVLEADILAWVYFKSGDLPGARDAIKRALSHDTPDAEMHYHAGMIAAASDDRGAAQKELGKALSLNPKFSLLKRRSRTGCWIKSPVARPRKR